MDDQTLALRNIHRISFFWQPSNDGSYTYLKLHGHGNYGSEKIRTIYDKLGLRAICPGPHTSTAYPEHKKYPYLLRNVEIKHCNHVWSTDISVP